MTETVTKVKPYKIPKLQFPESNYPTDVQTMLMDSYDLSDVLQIACTSLDLEVKESKIHGLGLFAKKDFEIG